MDYRTIETKLKFAEEGIHYDDLLDEEKERFEETFDDGIGEDIDSAALNEWLFKMKASKIRVNGEEQIVRTELQGQANLAFEALVTQAPPRVLEKNTCH